MNGTKFKYFEWTEKGDLDGLMEMLAQQFMI